MELPSSNEGANEDVIENFIGSPVPEKFAAITRRNQKESSLLRLPGEIRDTIYEYSFGGNLIIPYPDSSKGALGFKYYVWPPSPHSDGVKVINDLKELLLPTYACRQTQDEAAFAVYEANIFQVKPYGRFTCWLTTLSEKQRISIRTLLNGFVPEFCSSFSCLTTTTMLNELRGLKYIQVVGDLDSYKDVPIKQLAEKRSIIIQLPEKCYQPWLDMERFHNQALGPIELFAAVIEHIRDHRHTISDSE